MVIYNLKQVEMDCQAKIHDCYGGKYKCIKEATMKLTAKTWESHNNRFKTTVKCLCTNHGHRWKNRHNYRIKHCGSKSTITEESI